MRIPFDIKYRDKIESGEYKVETRDGRPARIICWDMISNVPIIALVAGNPSDKTDTSEYILTCFEKGNYLLTNESGNDLFIITPEPEMTEFENGMLRYLQDAANKKDDSEIVESTKEHLPKLLSLAKQQLLQSGELLTQEHHEKLMETQYEECQEELRVARGKEYTQEFHDALNEKKKLIVANLTEDKITGIQHDLIEFLSNMIDARWIDIVKTADAYAERIRAEALEGLKKNLCDNDVYRVPEWLREVLYMAKENGRKEALKDLPRWRKDKSFETEGTFMNVKGRGFFVVKDGYSISVTELIKKLPGFKEDRVCQQ